MPWTRWRVPDRDILLQRWREIQGTKPAAGRSGPSSAAPKQREQMMCDSHRVPMLGTHTRYSSTGLCRRTCMCRTVSSWSTISLGIKALILSWSVALPVSSGNWRPGSLLPRQYRSNIRRLVWWWKWERTETPDGVPNSDTANLDWTSIRVVHAREAALPDGVSDSPT